MKNVIIFVLAVVAALEFGALCVVVPDNAVKALKLRDLGEITDANSAELGVLNERIMNIREAMTFIVRASWYGRESGNTTASGERFNPAGMTAASRWLPLGSCWRVTNPQNGRSVVVRINDRGPGIMSRSLDLAEGAATLLGFRRAGLAQVRIQPEW
jgi:rare lipoprotein A (peptidoglycan hydrolase)